MNMRSCGAGEQFSPSIYHAGRFEDVASVMAELVRTDLVRSFAWVGYSMGGNLALKLAGELGSAPPPYLKAVVGVSPLVRLVETWHGGHCAFLSPEPGNAGFWSERTLLDFLLMTVEG